MTNCAADTGFETAADQVAIFNIQRCSIHDGPGIRTTVFLKGCPLRCDWCHNPEGLIGDAERWTVSDLVEEIERDRPFFEASGGGVTFSGGEPLSQPHVLVKCLEACRERRLHIAVDTSGVAAEDTISRIADLADVVLYDLKHMDSEIHRRHTGVDNAAVLANLRHLSAATDCEIWVRFPLVPGFNDEESNIDEMARFVASLHRRHPVFVLPYHEIGLDKWRRFGEEPPALDYRKPSDDELDAVAARLRAHGLEVCLGGADERTN